MDKYTLMRIIFGIVLILPLGGTLIFMSLASPKTTPNGNENDNKDKTPDINPKKRILLVKGIYYILLGVLFMLNILPALFLLFAFVFIMIFEDILIKRL